MKFPINASNQKHCPVCKKAGPGTRLPDTPRPEVATISFLAMPVPLGAIESLLTLGWDSGESKHPQSRSSLGASFVPARHRGKYNGFSQLHIEFCSTDCLREFLLDAVDELERRIEKVKPEVKRAKARAARA